MGSSDRLFNRQRTFHELLGGGLAADVILWRRKDLTAGILVGTLFSWVVFERSGYTLLSLVSNVFLLLFAILFLWAKSAAILNRPSPPLPHLYLSEEVMNGMATSVREHINILLSTFEDIALGRDSRTFIKVAGGLFIVSVVGSFTDFLSLCYASLVFVLMVPALYEKHEEFVDRYVLMGYTKLRHLYVKFDAEYIDKVQKWILERKKLS